MKPMIVYIIRYLSKTFSTRASSIRCTIFLSLVESCSTAVTVAWRRRKRLDTAAAMEKYEKIKVVGRGAFG